MTQTKNSAPYFNETHNPKYYQMESMIPQRFYGPTYSLRHHQTRDRRPTFVFWLEIGPFYFRGGRSEKDLRNYYGVVPDATHLELYMFTG